MHKFLSITEKEAAKVTHDINNVWHKRFQGKEYCVIETHSDNQDSPSYSYYFINHDFNDYEFLGKRLTRNGR